MKWKTNFNASIFLRAIFIVAIGILLFLSFYAYRHNENLNESSKVVMHTYEINIQLEKLMSAIKDAETGQRGYIITNNSRFLAPYLFSRNKVNSSFIKLKALTVTNPKQQENLRNLFVLVDKRFKSFENCLKYNDPATYDKRKLDNHMFGGRILMENIRFKVDEMIDIEKQYLEKKQREYNQEIRIGPILSIVLFLVALAFILLAYQKIRVDLNHLMVVNKRLLISTGQIAESEIIGQFSTWQWDLTTDKIEFSKNQFLLLGVKPYSFKPSLETFLSYVHPDDQEAFSQFTTSLKENAEEQFIYYKVTRADGQIRQFKSTGKLIEDAQGDSVLLGINFDITDEHLLNIELQQRNFELEKSNKELASFNHVASHDLQEPLRKIQTFISRISDKDNELLSENGRLYLSKIDISAKRMRVLIDDLLLFSRTSATNKEFVLSDLNELYGNALADINDIVEEKKATITVDPLPMLNVIPYQIEQLFINIIGNSLKYNKEDAPPIIHISSQQVLASSYPDLLNQAVKTYYKIAFTDNGLGFDAQFKNTIFVLFQRLHTKNDYPGTGIGLAICKKIVENHKGYILADSTPNQGATFTIFLPL